MLRAMIVAAAMMAASTPAHAQASVQLTSGAWTCWMTPLSGESGMDANLAFNPDGSLDGWFYMELQDGSDVVGMEFAIAGNWMLDGAVISSSVTHTDLLAGTLDFRLRSASAGGLAASSTQAEAKWKGVGIGLAAGAIIGAGLAGAAYAHGPYYGPHYVAHDYRRCRWVARYNSWGHYIGRTRVCSYPVY